MSDQVARAWPRPQAAPPEHARGWTDPANVGLGGTGGIEVLLDLGAPDRDLV